MSLLEEDTVLITQGPITEIVLNRPQSMNAINADVLQSLLLAFEKLRRYEELRVVTLWGAGEKAFAAGIEVAGLAGLGKRAAAEYLELGQRTLRAIESMRVPVVAAVQGYVFGAGLELALACDVIVSAHNAQFGFPEVGLGMIPAFGGIARLLQRVGPGMSKRMIYGGEMIDADTALKCGLLDVLAAPEALTSEAARLTASIARNAPLAVCKAKAIIGTHLEEMNFAAMRREAEGQLELFDTVDYEEGLEAFLQKREPKFRGR